MTNKELNLAWQIIANTDTHLFLTGKAGTGKTTFLRELRTNLPKRMVVLAPTGIAAINAQGTTIHSFFQLPFGPHIPGMQKPKDKRYQFRKNKIKLIRSLDLVVIDEISMVRADILDAIDEVLRQYRDRSRPFGGVQMLMIGDMQQLAPVARDEEWRLLSPHYDTPYFFSSKVLQETSFVTVELKHVYRQSDPYFLDILNKVRTNTADQQTLDALNQRYIPGFIPSKDDGYIRLTTHNYQADAINREELEALPTPASHYEAKISGDFPEISFPTEKTLTLKIGTQVMFVKNDSSSAKAYYNGMLGEIIGMDDDIISVLTYDEGKTLDVGHEQWENTRYTLDSKTKEVKEEIIGNFSQFPLKPAWAITVHKSQGLTFEHAIIDVQHSFAHGQTYVALSRCKTLEGMVLSAPIPPGAIISDQTVENFTNDPQHQEPTSQRLDNMQRTYLLRIIEELFSFTQLRYNIDALVRLIREYFYSSQPKQHEDWLATSEKFKGAEGVAARFHTQYKSLVMNTPDYKNDELLQERLKKGAEYFKNEIHFLWDAILDTKLPSNNKLINERLDNLMQTMKDNYKVKVLLFNYVANNGLHLREYLQNKAKIIINIDEENETKEKSSRSKTIRTSKHSKSSKSSSSTKKSSKPLIDLDDSLLPY